MKTILKFILVCIICFLSVGLLYFSGVLLYTTITEYKPEQEEVIHFTVKENKMLEMDKIYSMLSWNIGYAGLGKEMDFFYEGGERVRPEKEWNFSYLDGIKKFITENDSIDFFLMQEIDIRSHRSFNENQFENVQNKLPDFTGIFATNYKASFVPVPLYEPMGKVWGGMATYSKVCPVEALRLSTPGTYSWPKRLFMLKRCFIKTVFPLDNGKVLVIFNIHNSAFDDAAELRIQELELLKKEILAEFEKGNYVIAGGDWNQNPPRLDITKIKKYVTKESWPIPDDYFPTGWQWAFDASLPTNRDVDKPFNPSKTACTIIDFYLVSPNIHIENIRTIDRQFYFSDHMPVKLIFSLN